MAPLVTGLGPYVLLTMVISLPGQLVDVMRSPAWMHAARACSREADLTAPAAYGLWRSLVPYQATFARFGRQPVARNHRRLGYLRGLQPGVPAAGIMSWCRIAGSGTLGLNERHPTSALRRTPRRGDRHGRGGEEYVLASAFGEDRPPHHCSRRPLLAAGLDRADPGRVARKAEETARRRRLDRRRQLPRHAGSSTQASRTRSCSSTHGGGSAHGARSCVGFERARLTSSCQTAVTSPVCVGFATNGAWFGASGESAALSAKES